MTIDGRFEAIAQSLELLTTDVRSLERTVAAIAEAVRSHDGQITGLTTASMSLLEAVLQPRAAPEPTGGRRVMLLVPGTKYYVHGAIHGYRN